jgi:diacylglycerol kinase family enzyme
VERALAGWVKLVDTRLANGRPFLNAAGSGFDAEVAREALSAPWPLREVRPTSTRSCGLSRVVLDGRVVHRGRSLLISAQNGPRSGGSFPLAPEASIDDGLLDVVIAGEFSRPATLGILPRVAGRHPSEPPAGHVAARTKAECGVSRDRPIWRESFCPLAGALKSSCARRRSGSLPSCASSTTSLRSA